MTLDGEAKGLVKPLRSMEQFTEVVPCGVNYELARRTAADSSPRTIDNCGVPIVGMPACRSNRPIMIDCFSAARSAIRRSPQGRVRAVCDRDSGHSAGGRLADLFASHSRRQGRFPVQTCCPTIADSKGSFRRSPTFATLARRAAASLKRACALSLQTPPYRHRLATRRRR